MSAGGANKIKAVSYVRVSTEMQANKEFSSTEVQEKIIRDYVANHPEYVLVDSFADRGRSAKNMNRPAIKQLIERIKQSDIRVVLSYRLDRVSREKLSFYEFEALLKSHNVKLIYTNDINFEDNSQKLTSLRNRLSEVNSELSYFKSKVSLSGFQIKAFIENLDYCKDMLTPDEKSEILKETISKMVLSVKKRKGHVRIFQLTLFPTSENQQAVVIEFSVDNSRGRGIWEILSPFELSSGYKKPLPKNQKIKRHFLHSIVKLKRILTEEDLSIRELAKMKGVKHGMLGRQLKMLDRLSLNAIEVILKLRFQRQTKLLTFRKLEEISKQPQDLHVKLVKKLANLR